MMAVPDQSAIDSAVKRLALALDSLDAAVERRREADRSEEGLASQLHALGVDRTRPAPGLPPRSTVKPRVRAGWRPPTARSRSGWTPPSAASSRCWTGTSELMS